MRQRLSTQSPFDFGASSQIDGLGRSNGRPNGRPFDHRSCNRPDRALRTSIADRNRRPPMLRQEHDGGAARGALGDGVRSTRRVCTPERDWPSKNRPAFPFEYIRYEAFLRAVETLARVGECSFHPFDWNSFTISHRLRAVTLTKPVVIEGVSC